MTYFQIRNIFPKVIQIVLSLSKKANMWFMIRNWLVSRPCSRSPNSRGEPIPQKCDSDSGRFLRKSGFDQTPCNSLSAQPYRWANSWKMWLRLQGDSCQTRIRSRVHATPTPGIGSPLPNSRVTSHESRLTKGSSTRGNVASSWSAKRLKRSRHRGRRLWGPSSSRATDPASGRRRMRPRCGRARPLLKPL